MQEEQTPEHEDRPEPQKVSLCQGCGGETYEDIVKAAFWHDERLILIEDILARICKNCGEQFYDDETAQRLHGLIAAPPAKPKEEILVPVYSLADAR
jgi:YgiT-type zinc finger domain-containing protein